jgi:hypothetical protein
MFEGRNNPNPAEFNTESQYMQGDAAGFNRWMTYLQGDPLIPDQKPAIMGEVSASITTLERLAARHPPISNAVNVVVAELRRIEALAAAGAAAVRTWQDLLRESFVISEKAETFLNKELAEAKAERADEPALLKRFEVKNGSVNTALLKGPLTALHGTEQSIGRNLAAIHGHFFNIVSSLKNLERNPRFQTEANLRMQLPTIEGWAYQILNELSQFHNQDRIASEEMSRLVSNPDLHLLVGKMEQIEKGMEKLNNTILTLTKEIIQKITEVRSAIH